MRHFRYVGRRGRILLTGALAACLLAGAPAANAVFTSSLNVGPLPIGTYKLAAPAGNTVTASCAPTGSSGKYKMNITVSGYGSVAKATNYILAIRDNAGLLQSTVDLTAAGPWSYTSSNAAAGWGYTIDAQYRVPSSTNIWSSSAPIIHLC